MFSDAAVLGLKELLIEEETVKEEKKIKNIKNSIN